METTLSKKTMQPGNGFVAGSINEITLLEHDLSGHTS